MELDGVRQAVHPGHVIFLPRGTEHSISTADDVAVFYNVHARAMKDEAKELRNRCDKPWE